MENDLTPGQLYTVKIRTRFFPRMKNSNPSDAAGAFWLDPGECVLYLGEQEAKNIYTGAIVSQKRFLYDNKILATSQHAEYNTKEHFELFADES